MCEICNWIERTKSLYDDTNSEALDEAIATAYITGFACGFNVRKETTYAEYCQRHAEEMRGALRAAGAFAVPLVAKGSG